MAAGRLQARVGGNESVGWLVGSFVPLIGLTPSCLRERYSVAGMDETDPGGKWGVGGGGRYTFTLHSVCVCVCVCVC